MFTAPQITSTAVIPAPVLNGANKKGSLPYTPMFEVCYTHKHKPETTTDGTLTGDPNVKTKRFIGVTLSETLNETGANACTAQLSGSTIVRLLPANSKSIVVSSAGPGAPKRTGLTATPPLKFGDILYGAKDGYVTSSCVRYMTGEGVITKTRHNKNNLNAPVTVDDPQFYQNTLADTRNIAVNMKTPVHLATADVIPVGRFISHMGKIGDYDYVNMLICRNPLRRVPALDGGNVVYTPDAIWYAHPCTGADLRTTKTQESGWYTTAPVLGQVRESKKAALCSTSHLAFLTDRLYRSCGGLPGTWGRKDIFYTELPFAPNTGESKYSSGCVAPDSVAGHTVPIVW